MHAYDNMCCKALDICNYVASYILIDIASVQGGEHNISGCDR